MTPSQQQSYLYLHSELDDDNADADVESDPDYDHDTESDIADQYHIVTLSASDDLDDCPFGIDSDSDIPPRPGSRMGFNDKEPESPTAISHSFDWTHKLLRKMGAVDSFGNTSACSSSDDGDIPLADRDGNLDLSESFSSIESMDLSESDEEEARLCYASTSEEDIVGCADAVLVTAPSTRCISPPLTAETTSQMLVPIPLEPTKSNPSASPSHADYLPSPLSPRIRSTSLADIPLRHRYQNRGYSRHALLRVKALWAKREEEWIDEMAMREYEDALEKESMDSGHTSRSVYDECGAVFNIGLDDEEESRSSDEPVSISFPAPPSDLPKVELVDLTLNDMSPSSSTSPTVSSTPSSASSCAPSISPRLTQPEPLPPLSIHPRKGDLSFLRDPLCVHVDRFFVGMPVWTMSKAAWMFDLYVADRARVEAERSAEKVYAQTPLEDEGEEDSDTDTETDGESLQLSVLSDDSDATLVESESDTEASDARVNTEKEDPDEGYDIEKTPTLSAQCRLEDAFLSDCDIMKAPPSHKRRLSTDADGSEDVTYSALGHLISGNGHVISVPWQTSWIRRTEVFLEISRVHRENEAQQKKERKVSTPIPVVGAGYA
jgi:hypothetical protein